MTDMPEKIWVTLDGPDERPVVVSTYHALCSFPDAIEYTRTPDEAALIAQEAALQAAGKCVMEWQPIETAPKDYTSVIGWNGTAVCEIRWIEDEDDREHTGWCRSGFSNGGNLYVLHNRLGEEPTHWRPLPNPPTEGE